MTDRKVFTKMIPLYPDRWCWWKHSVFMSSGKRDEITCCWKCCLKGNLFLVRSSANLYKWMVNMTAHFHVQPIPCHSEWMFSLLRGRGPVTWGLRMWFNHLPHPQSFVCCRAHCAEYGGECVSWQQMHATWGIGFEYQVFEPPVSQRKGWNTAPRWIILLMDKILHQERMIIIPLLIGFEPSQVVQDFVHQQYCKNARDIAILQLCLLARKIILLVCDPLDRLERGLGIRIDGPAEGHK